MLFCIRKEKNDKYNNAIIKLTVVKIKTIEDILLDFLFFHSNISLLTISRLHL